METDRKNDGPNDGPKETALVVVRGEILDAGIGAGQAIPHIPTWAYEAQRLLLADHRSPDTQRAYQLDIALFFQWTGRENTPESVTWLCSHESGPLALLLNGFKAHMTEQGLAAATINRRLAAVRSLLRFARRLGASCPDPHGLVESEKSKPYRDTAGPGIDALVEMINTVDSSTLSGKRDAAILALFAENALRRGELCRCNVGDFEPDRKRLLILGKGRGGQKEPITLTMDTVETIEQYLKARRKAGEILTDDSPLFASYGRGTRAADGRLTGKGIWLIVSGYAQKATGKHVAPHQLRHTALTAALDATGGDLRKVQRLSRHADIRTLVRYDDNRLDLQGEVTGILSEILKAKKSDGKG